MGRERDRGCEDILCQTQAFPRGSSKRCRGRCAGCLCCCTKRSNNACGFLLLLLLVGLLVVGLPIIGLLLVGLDRWSLVGGRQGLDRVGGRRVCRIVGRGLCFARFPATLLRASS